MKWYSQAVYVFGAVFVAIGAALLVVTAVHGGGVIGFLLGARSTGLDGRPRCRRHRRRR